MKNSPIEDKVPQPFALDPELMQKMTKTIVDDLTAVNTSLVSYAQHSLRTNLSAAEEMRQCQSPQDIVDIQMRLARQAYDDYLVEARQIGDLLTKLSNDALGYLTLQRPV